MIACESVPEVLLGFPDAAVVFIQMEVEVQTISSPHSRQPTAEHALTNKRVAAITSKSTLDDVGYLRYLEK